MLSGKLWPMHPHPLPGECLSSWLVRTAHANGLKIQTFSICAFGNQKQVWNRDIDRQSPDWILIPMSEKTGTSLKVIDKTTLKLYEKRLFPMMKTSGQLRWVLPLKMTHRVYKGFGMQYCPLCLAEDDTPYFRLAWRLGFFTFCPKHRTLLSNKCWNCDAPVAFHRTELGKPNVFDISGLDECWRCGESLTQSPVVPIDIDNQVSLNMWTRVLKAVQRNFVNSGPLNYERLVLLHQVCKLLSSHRYYSKLTDYIHAKSLIRPQKVEFSSSFEALSVTERHYVLQMAWWLIGANNKKLKIAISQGAIQKNYLYRDSNEPCLAEWRQC
ncbi:hypothetical protein EYS14_06000 [Alteromonadaceae bacterium M269]|nr:hypothetical protein EYS14_06000 [Alteromonadaceae bacterium M269]